MRADDPDIDEDGEVDVEHYPVPAWLAPYMESDEDEEEPVDALAEFDEADHPRDKTGKWVHVGSKGEVQGVFTDKAEAFGDQHKFKFGTAVVNTQTGEVRHPQTGKKIKETGATRGYHSVGLAFQQGMDAGLARLGFDPNDVRAPWRMTHDQMAEQFKRSDDTYTDGDRARHEERIQQARMLGLLGSGGKPSHAERARAALADVDEAGSVRGGWEPEWAAESRGKPPTGAPGSFVPSESRGTMSGGKPWAARDITAYDDDGKAVGVFSVATTGADAGAFKITVRPDALRKGWGSRLLDAAMAHGIDVPGIVKRNKFTHEGRELVRAWLARQAEPHALAEWDESKHHRGQPGNAGQFGPGGGGTATKERQDVDDDDDDRWRATSKRERAEDEEHAKKAARNVAIAVSGSNRAERERTADKAEERGYDPADFEHGVTLIKKHPTTKDAYYDVEKGTWNPKRRKVHEAVITHLFANSKRPDGRPVLHVLGGGSGAGKGELQRQHIVKFHDGVVKVDPDEVKQLLPEFGHLKKAADDRAANFVHSESSDVGVEASHKAMREGLNVVLDSTGNGTLQEFKERVGPAIEKGHYIRADYATIPTNEAVNRANERAKKEPGRGVVPEHCIRYSHAAVSRTFPAAVKAGLFHEARLWSNDGKTPRLIYEFHHEKGETVHDAEAYKAFLAKGAEWPE